MSFKYAISAVTLSLALSGCASGLNSMQEREYAAFKQNNVLIEEKSPSSGIVFGLLPGGGSFYVREPGYGVINLLFWPLSILWDPISGYEGAKAINYDVTKYKLKQDKEMEIRALDDLLAAGQLGNTEYILAKRKIDDKYNYQ